MNPPSLEPERLGNLPANIIDNILSRLPLRDAARTSVLSREWRYRWKWITDLVFDYRFDKAFLPKHQLKDIINQVLLHHQGSINKFSLQLPSFYIIRSHIDQWLHFLSNHQLQDLTVDFCLNGNYRLPSSFFAFQHLTKLKIYRCVLELPPGFKGFTRLVSLDCQEVAFATAFFTQFVSQCPHLEKLRVVSCTEWDTIEIEGPELRCITFHGFFKSIRFRNCSVLAQVSLSTPIFDRGHIHSPTFEVHGIIPVSTYVRKKYFHFVPTLEKLHLHPGMLEFLGAGGSPNQLPSSLNHLRFLNLSLYLDTVEEVSFALCLVRSSPNLAMLRITFYASKIVDAVVEYIRVQETPDCGMNQLKNVVIELFSGTESQKEFVSYLLAAAAALEEMAIRSVSHDGGLGLMSQLRQLPRASPNAQIHVR